MAKLTRAGKRDYKIRELAQSIVANCPGKDWLCEADAIRKWVRSSIRYLRDINGIETVHTPTKLLELRQGDCDDQAILVAALLESVGHPARFVALSLRPGEFNHVFAETKIGRRWVSLETTEPVKIGWQPPRVLKRLIVYV